MKSMKRRNVLPWLTVTAAFGLTGCGVIYEPTTSWNYNGYSSTDLDATTVDVRFSNSRGALASTVRDLAMYRCAEITLERGFQGFIVLSGRAFASTAGKVLIAEADIRMRMFSGSALRMKQALQDTKVQVYEAAELLRRLEVVVRRRVP